MATAAALEKVEAAPQAVEVAASVVAHMAGGREATQAAEMVAVAVATVADVPGATLAEQPAAAVAAAQATASEVRAEMATVMAEMAVEYSG